MSYQQYRPSNFNILPIVIKNLLILNGIFFLTTLVLKSKFGIDLEDKLGLHYPFSEEFQPFQVITYLFMHATTDANGNLYIWHIVSNMFALWMFGGALENFWGPKRFLIYYFITGIGAAICHYIIFYFNNMELLHFIDNYIANPSLADFTAFLSPENIKFGSQEMVDQYNQLIPTFNQAVTQNNVHEALRISADYMRTYKADFLNLPVIVGASGSVFGILLAFGMLFPNTILYIYFAIPMKAKWFVLLYGIFELYSGINVSAGDNVAHFAHLGGMLFGFILIKYWQKTNKKFY